MGASKWDRLLTSTLVVCALVTTGIVVYRQFFAPPASPVASAPQRAVLVEDWQSRLNKGIQLGETGAPVEIVEFADIECPFCADLHLVLKSLREKYPTKILVRFVHYPLPMHRMARPAARAAECAGDQQKFEAMLDLLFEKQRELGLRPWSDFAVEAGVPDLLAFRSCVESRNPIPRVEEGQRLGRELDVKGTPTLVVNGWKLVRPPDEEELDRMVEAILAGKSPNSAEGNTIE